MECVYYKNTLWLHLIWRIFMNCVGIFITPTSVVLAVYFAAYCEPCITQEKYKFQYIIFVFALNPCLNSFPHFCVLFSYVVLLTQDVFHKTFSNIFSMTHTLCILQNCWKWTLFIQQHTVLTRTNSLPSFNYSTTEELYHHLALQIRGCNTLPLCNWVCYFLMLWSYISEVHWIMQTFFLTYWWVTEHSFLWRPGLPVWKVTSSPPPHPS